MSGFLHPDQHVRNATQNNLCRAVNRRRGCCACRASNCQRRARFSRTRSSRERKTLTNQPKKCRSDTIMARILAEKSESSFSPSHSFCSCTMFWRGTRPPNALPHITFEHLSAVVCSHHANKISPKPCATRLEENVWIPNAWKNLPKRRLEMDAAPDPARRPDAEREWRGSALLKPRRSASQTRRSANRTIVAKGRYWRLVFAAMIGRPLGTIRL